MKTYIRSSNYSRFVENLKSNLNATQQLIRGAETTAKKKV
jgi:hypothetical protein